MKRSFVSGASRSILTAVAVLAGIQVSHGDLTYPGCAALSASDFKEVVLVARGTGSGNPTATVTDGTMIEPVSLWVHTDGRVYWTERATSANTAGSTSAVTTGRLRVFNPSTNTAKTVATFNVSAGVSSGQIGNNELGLRSFTLDPNYDQNHFAYVYYMPRTTVTNRGVDTMILARFVMPTLDTLDLTTQKKLLKMPWTPGICCHQGGGMDWDAQGNLYLSTGNNAENIDNYAPMNDSIFANATGDNKDRATQDNQARAANTMDWRGKILRIHPDSTDPRGYTIPAGNLRQKLFEIGGAWVAGQDTTKILPEIYTFGHRNPYSLSVDKPTGWIVWGEVGPDQTSPASSSRGPVARDEWNIARGPGFFGWPYFVGDQRGYNMWNPATNGYALPVQNPDTVFNNSPNNTGLTKLPPAVSCILPESKLSSDNTFNFQNSGTNTASVTGPIYHYDSTLVSAKKWPPHFDKKWVVAEGAKFWVKFATLNSAGTAVTNLDSMPGANANTVIRANVGPSSGGFGPIALRFGPDGALYIVYYAASNFASTTSTRISRIEYQGTCNPTVALMHVATPDQKRQLLRGFLYAPGVLPVWPEGMTRVEAFDLAGKKLFAAARTGNSLHVLLPENLRASLLQVRFAP